MLQLQLQATTDSLTQKLMLFEDNLSHERKRFLGELCDVENWLEEVYAVLERDPIHEHVPCYTPEEVHAMQEEYSDDGVIEREFDAAATEEGASQEQVNSESVDGTDGSHDFSVHREVTISGSSLGSDIIDHYDGIEQLDTSVDVEMSDEQYQQQVMSRVLSGSSSPSSSSSSSHSPSHLEQSGPFETSVDPFDDPVDPVGDEWAGMMEEETDFQTDTASMSSASTLQGEGQGLAKSPDSKRVAVELSEDEVNIEEAKPDSEKVEEKNRGKSLADELGELGVELEQDFGEEEVVNEEAEESEPESRGM